MAIPRQQFVALQSKYLFHLVSLSSNPNLARNRKELRDRHHVLEGFQLRGREGVVERIMRTPSWGDDGGDG